jgi:hypothetical protein
MENIDWIKISPWFKNMRFSCITRDKGISEDTKNFFKKCWMKYIISKDKKSIFIYWNKEEIRKNNKLDIDNLPKITYEVEKKYNITNI